MSTTGAAVLWPLGAYIAGVVGVVCVMVGASFFLGNRRNDRATGEPYESGIVSEGSARVRMTSQFYLMAMLFVIFDLEAVFIFSWATAVRELGWTGYAVISLFIVLLLISLVYLCRVGALRWGPAQPNEPAEVGTTGADPV